MTTEKTVAKAKADHGECSQSVTFANDKQATDVTGTLYDEDGVKARVGLAGEIKQAKSEWKVTGTLDVKANDLGGAKAALAVSIPCHIGVTMTRHDGRSVAEKIVSTLAL